MNEKRPALARTDKPRSLEADWPRFMRFVLVGLASTLVYFGLLITLEPVISSIILLTAFCYLASMVANYVAQSRFTFRFGTATMRSVYRFGLMHLFSMISNSAAMWALVSVLHFPLVGAQVIVTGCLAVTTFFISKLWVYRR